MKFAPIPKCVCGKMSFDSHEAAKAGQEALKQKYLDGKWESKGGYKYPPMAGGIHSCHIVPNTWHITSSKRSGKVKLGNLEQELHRDMATIADEVVAIMHNRYNNGGGYKFTVDEIWAELKKTRPSMTKGQTSAAVSKLKPNVITDLDETVKGEGIRPHKLFTLVKILEKVTRPSTTPITPKQSNNNVGGTAMSDKAETRVAVPTNPFDKVFSILGDLQTKVNGLAKGYGEIANKPVPSDERVMAAIDLVIKAIEDKETFASPAAVSVIIKGIREIKESLKDGSTTSASIDFSNLAKEVNNTLIDTGNDNALIYRIREELDDRALATESRLRNCIDSLVITPPSGVTNVEDYKTGLREGIEMAIKMGLNSTSI